MTDPTPIIGLRSRLAKLTDDPDDALWRDWPETPADRAIDAEIMRTRARHRAAWLIGAGGAIIMGLIAIAWRA